MSTYFTLMVLKRKNYYSKHDAVVRIHIKIYSGRQH